MMVRPQATRPTYTSEQLEQYFKCIQFPDNERCMPELANTGVAKLFVQKLLKYQLAHIPFENLEMHYSSHHTITLDTEHLFHKMVERANGRGGYCMENNLFFGTVLRSLGFDVMPVGARVSSAANLIDGQGLEGATYSGFSHTVNIVTIEEAQYFCDVGFGSRGPTTLIPLKEGVVGYSVGDDENGGTLFQLRKEHIADNTHAAPEQLLWVYSARFHDKMPWLPVYCFTQIEFLPQDFVNMSFYINKSPTSWFNQHVLCAKFLLDEASEMIIGDVSLFDREIKERKFGQSKKLALLTTEAERVEALQKHLGIRLTRPEVHGIKGLVTTIT